VAINITDPQAEDTQTTLATRSHVRDDDQKGIDATVKTMVDGYNALGGKDSEVTARPTHRYQVPNDDKSELKRMIRRACVLHKVDPIWYVDSKPDDAGNIVVKFTVGPKVEKVATPATANGETATPPADAPPADPDADTGGEQPQAEARKRFGR
jgi:hypothetical protein